MKMHFILYCRDVASNVSTSFIWRSFILIWYEYLNIIQKTTIAATNRI